MGARSRRVAALVVAAALLGGCFSSVPIHRPPTAGYGPPYQGTGEVIFLKDSRGDRTIEEGKHPITPEQALEAAGDKEYEARRQIAKAHNDVLYREAKRHRRRATVMIYSSLVLVAIGVIGGSILASSMKETTTMPATATDPEMQVIGPGSASKNMSALGWALGITGTIGVGYGIYGGLKQPPYYAWRIPHAMDRPAYIRQQTELYNEKLGGSAPMEGDDEPLKPPPGQGRPKSIPRPRGGQR